MQANSRAESIANEIEANVRNINQELRDGSATVGETLDALTSEINSARARLTDI